LIRLPLISLFIFFPLASKETSYVIIPISIGWFLVAALRNHLNSPDLQNGFKIRRDFLISVLSSSFFYFTLRQVFLPFGVISQGYSSNYSSRLERMLASSRIWIDWLIRDYLFVIPLAIILVFWFFAKRAEAERVLIIDAGVWMLGWIALFIPWQHQQEYYQLPFSVGGGLAAGAILGRVFQREDVPPIAKRLTFLLALTSLLLLVLTLPNNYTQGRLQLLVDRTNAETIEYVRDNLPANSTLYLNLSKNAQYVWDLEQFLNDIYEREEIRVEGFTLQNPDLPESSQSNVYLLAPYLKNQYYPSIRMGV
jgi:hypothetical protein